MSRIGRIELRWFSRLRKGEAPLRFLPPVLQYREFLDPHEGCAGHDVYLGPPQWSEWKDVPAVQGV